jgi:hypothetical protein
MRASGPGAPTDAFCCGSPIWQVDALKRLQLRSGDSDAADRNFKQMALYYNPLRAFPSAFKP